MNIVDPYTHPLCHRASLCGLPFLSRVTYFLYPQLFPGQASSGFQLPS